MKLLHDFSSMDCKSRRNINAHPKRKIPRTALAANRMAVGLYPKYITCLSPLPQQQGKCTQSQAAELAPSTAQSKLCACHDEGTCCQTQWDVCGGGSGLSPHVWVDGPGHRDSLFNVLGSYNMIGKSSGTPRDSTAYSDPGWR